MTGYKFYLTKSREVADLIRDGLKSELSDGDAASVGSGCVNNDDRIPAIYHNDGWYYACVEYRNSNRPRYRIIFA